LPTIIGGTDSFLATIKYPEIGLRASVEGTVILEFIIDSLGIINIRSLNVIKGIGAGLEEIAMDALLKQKYTPAMNDGVVLNLKMRVTIKFTVIPKQLNRDFFSRLFYFNKDELKSKTRFSLYPPPTKEQCDSVNTTGN